jgi:hypothetical protein
MWMIRGSMADFHIMDRISDGSWGKRWKYFITWTVAFFGRTSLVGGISSDVVDAGSGRRWWVDELMWFLNIWQSQGLNCVAALWGCSRFLVIDNKVRRNKLICSLVFIFGTVQATKDAKGVSIMLPGPCGKLAKEHLNVPVRSFYKHT